MDAGSDLPRWRIVREQAAVLAMLVVIASARGAAQSRGSGQLTTGTAATLEASRLSSEPQLPVNLVAPNIIVPLLEKMWQRSVSFRRQCVRLGDYPEVVVTIELAKEIPGTTGARMRANRRRHRLTATIEVDLRKPALFAEHLAHELEHVLEEIDGIDLPRLASQRVAGVIDGEGGYETARAMAVGRAAAREARIP
jgi:hypothetical protein